MRSLKIWDLVDSETSLIKYSEVGPVVAVLGLRKMIRPALGLALVEDEEREETCFMMSSLR